MSNIETISASITTSLTIGELKEIFMNNNNLELLRGGNFKFCTDILSKFGFDLINVNLDSILEVNIDIEKDSKVVLQGPRINMYDEKNHLISKKLPNNEISPFYCIYDFEVQIFEELNFDFDNFDNFLKENNYSEDFISSDICSLIHMSGYELDEKKFKNYKDLLSKFEESGNEKLEPFVNEALKKIYSYQELYIAKDLMSKTIKIMHT